MKLMKLRIKKLRATTTLGVYDWEIAKKREVIIHMELAFDGAAAVQSDDMSDAIDYSEIEQQALDYLYHNRFDLIETVACRLAEQVMQDARVRHIIVEVEKPGALRFAESVSAIYEAER